MGKGERRSRATLRAFLQERPRRQLRDVARKKRTERGAPQCSPCVCLASVRFVLLMLNVTLYLLLFFHTPRRSIWLMRYISVVIHRNTGWIPDIDGNLPRFQDASFIEVHLKSQHVESRLL